MHVLQSNGYMFEDSLILLEDILHLIERCLVCCRDFLCNMLLPTCFFLPEAWYQVRYEMDVCLCFKFSNAYLHVGEKTTT